MGRYGFTGYNIYRLLFNLYIMNEEYEYFVKTQKIGEKGKRIYRAKTRKASFTFLMNEIRKLKRIEMEIIGGEVMGGIGKKYMENFMKFSKQKKNLNGRILGYRENNLYGEELNIRDVNILLKYIEGFLYKKDRIHIITNNREMERIMPNFKMEIGEFLKQYPQLQLLDIEEGVKTIMGQYGNLKKTSIYPRKNNHIYILIRREEYEQYKKKIWEIESTYENVKFFIYNENIHKTWGEEYNDAQLVNKQKGVNLQILINPQKEFIANPYVINILASTHMPIGTKIMDLSFFFPMITNMDFIDLFQKKKEYISQKPLGINKNRFHNNITFLRYLTNLFIIYFGEYKFSKLRNNRNINSWRRIHYKIEKVIAPSRIWGNYKWGENVNKRKKYWEEEFNQFRKNSQIRLLQKSIEEFFIINGNF